MVHSAVEDDEGGAARDLHAQHARQVEPGRAGEEAAGLDDEAGGGERGRQVREELGGALLHRAEVERFLVREVRDTEAAADIDRVRRLAGDRRERGAQLDGVAPLREQDAGIEDLRARELVQAAQAEPPLRAHARRRLGQALLVDAEGGRVTAHLHPAAGDRARRIDPDGDVDGAAGARRERAQQCDLVLGLDVDLADAAGNDLGQLGLALAGAGEDDALGRAAGGTGAQVLGGRGDLTAGARVDEHARDVRVGIGLDRVVDVDTSGQCGAQRGEPVTQDRGVVDVERRAVRRGERLDGDTADREHAGGLAEQLGGEGTAERAHAFGPARSGRSRL